MGERFLKLYCGDEQIDLTKLACEDQLKIINHAFEMVNNSLIPDIFYFSLTSQTNDSKVRYNLEMIGHYNPSCFPQDLR